MLALAKRWGYVLALKTLRNFTAAQLHYHIAKTENLQDRYFWSSLVPSAPE